MSDNMKKETRKENNAIALANATAKHTFHRTFMLSKQPHYFYDTAHITWIFSHYLWLFKPFLFILDGKKSFIFFQPKNIIVGTFNEAFLTVEQ